MRIFIRANEILIANVSELVERSENPAKLVRLIVAEMEEAIIGARKDASRLNAERNAVRREIECLDGQQADWSDKARLAMSKDRMDLAKGALTEREKAVDAVAKRRKELVELDAAIVRNDADTATLVAKLDEARARQKTILAGVEAAREVPARSPSRVDDALGRFDILEQRVAFAEARFGTPADREAQTLARELGELDIASRVEAGLQALKDKAERPRKTAGGKRR